MAACVGSSTIRPTVPVLVSAGGRKWPTYALLDTGANCSAITDDLCHKIQAPLKTLNIKLGTFDKNDVSQREVASFSVSNLTETFKIDVNNALVGSFLSTQNERPPKRADFVQYDHLKDIVFNELDDDSVDLLLDAKFASAFLTGRVHIGKSGEPIGIETYFGTAVIGPKPDDGSNLVVNNDLCCLDVESNSFAEEIRRLFRHDFIAREGERFPAEMTHLSKNDETSLEQMNATVKFNSETNHYSVGLPWRHGREETAELFKNIDFYSAAQSRHEKLKKKFQKNETLKAGSFAQMREKLAKGFVKEIETLDAPEESPVCYLPVHVALHPEKPGKFRLCMDGAAKVGVHSLNKHLLSGPDYFNRLVSVLFRFRQKKFTLTGDIQDFFYQVECDPLDRPALRCLWWSDETMSKTITLQANVHIFGAGSSPAVAHFVLRHHAEQIRNRYPSDVCNAIRNLMYVDDMLASTHTEKEAKELKENLEKAFAEGGFKITKWRSNIPELSEKADSITTSPSFPQQKPAMTSSKDNDAGEESSDDGATPMSEGNGLDDSDKICRLKPEELHCAPGGEPMSTTEESEETDPKELVSSLSNDYESAQAKEFLNETPDKILGVGYDYDSDVMAVRVKEKHFKQVITKRDMLSWIASVYDPLGLVAPYILKGRHFFQLVNECGISWNDPVPDHILAPFNQWKDKVVHLRRLKIPRWTEPLGFSDCQRDLVLFSDSSAWAYGFTAYLRQSLQGGGNEVSVSLLIGKAHVVPLNMSKTLSKDAIPHGDSIPRLELNAARGAAELRDTIVREYGEPFDNVYMFTDSLTVLGWLGNFEKRFKTYENFRVKAIRALSNLSEWRHCPTNLNPADLCSKAIEANDFVKWTFYHKGPTFLCSPVAEWPPSRPAIEQKDIDVSIGAIAGSIEDPRTISPVSLLVTGATTEDPEIVVEHQELTPWPIKVTEKIDRWEKKIRRIALIRRVILTLRDRVKEKKENLTSSRLRPRANEKKPKLIVVFTEEEKNKAEYLLVSAIQSISFEKELLSLIKHGVFSPNALSEMKVKNSPLTTLSPYIDQENVMRSSSRIRKAEFMTHDSRFPIILPNHKNEFVCSLIRYHHSKYQNMHMGISDTYHELMKKYFILGGKTSVSYVLNRCTVCQRLNKLPSKQRQGDLPVERLEPTCPFKFSGIDCFGPYYLRHSVGRGQQKRFVLLVCCMSTRAVAMYPLKNMSTSAVINALLRMNNSFPGLKKIFSDQGSNFKGADREIREAVAAWNKQQVNAELSKVGITWEFGPASCGSAGGAWERLIGLSKRLIKSVLQGKNIDSDDFDTVIAGAAAIMNRRPLMAVSANPEDPLVLSPAHFLYPYVFANSSTNIMPPHSGEPERLRSGWRATQAMLDEFFTRFKKEYIQTLARRSTTASAVNIPKVGDVVLLKEDSLPREEWRVCRIIEVTNEDKTHPRHFTLKDSKNTLLKRNIDGFVHLEL